MLSPDSRALYIASAILFLLPWSLLFGSWLAFHRAKITAPLPCWRRFLVYAALMVAFVSTALNVIWNASWLNHGGSPHDMGAGPPHRRRRIKVQPSPRRATRFLT